MFNYFKWINFDYNVDLAILNILDIILTSLNGTEDDENAKTLFYIHEILLERIKKIIYSTDVFERYAKEMTFLKTMSIQKDAIIETCKKYGIDHVHGGNNIVHYYDITNRPTFLNNYVLNVNNIKRIMSYKEIVEKYVYYDISI
jgi:LPS O-antigen subunit length determinant protein (WzzB/FepE family)